MKLISLLIFLVSCSTLQTPISTQVDTATVIMGPRAVFFTNSKIPWVINLVGSANCVVNTKAFINEVKTYPKFTLTTATPADVAASLESMGPFEVATYKTTNPLSKAIATTFKGNKTTLFLNVRRNPRALPAMVNTLAHESLHLAGYSHGDNSPVGKEESVNYKVGSISEKYLEGCL